MEPADVTAPPPPQRRRRLLLVAEAVTLAHVARPAALARALDPEAWDIVLARPAHAAGFTAGEPFAVVDCDGADPAAFARALADGRPVTDLATLGRLAADDRRLLDAHRPDAVVGDFRLSLAAAARTAAVPYLSIANAYWTPLARPEFPLPVLPLSRRLPLPLARALFAIGRPMAFAAHARPVDRLLRAHGLPGVGADLRRAYSDADQILLPDAPGLFQVDHAAAPDDFAAGTGGDGADVAATWLGPLAWSPPVAPPPWWDEPPPAGRRDVYVGLGSSGPTQALPRILEALAALPVRALVSTAGRAVDAAALPAHARAAPYLPGDDAARRAALVVCNGGSLGVQQALAHGVPVLAVASNMDQFLNMVPVVAAGAGRVVRADRLDVGALRRAATELLDDAGPARAAARRLSAQVGTPIDVRRAFDAAVARARRRMPRRSPVPGPFSVPGPAPAQK